MEESPHKCPVCNRSFNQRSNLKTHLLTHTDHKPYECNCGKVFRRNCDLRRHALTHAVGDVPGSEPLDPNIDDLTGMSGDEEDTVLEVDSPLHSPTNAARSPSPVQMPVSAELQDEEENDLMIEEDNREEPRQREEPPPTPSPIKSEKDCIAITHCHHERPYGSRSPYTMRPPNHYEREYNLMQSPLSLTSNSLTAGQYQDTSSTHMHPPSSHSTSSRSEIFVPMLHVRRDLHHKLGAAGRTSTVTSGLLDHHPHHPTPNFLSSVPLRKRPIGPDGEPHLPMIGRNMIYSLHRNHPLLKPPEDLMMPQIVSPTEMSSTSHDQLMHSTIPSQPPAVLLGSPNPLISPVPSSHQAPAQVAQVQAVPIPPPAPAAAPTPPRRTGFSIEDIMRR